MFGRVGLDLPGTPQAMTLSSLQKHKGEMANWFAIVIVHFKRDLLALHIMATPTLGALARVMRERLRPQGQSRKEG